MDGSIDPASETVLDRRHLVGRRQPQRRRPRHRVRRPPVRLDRRRRDRPSTGRRHQRRPRPVAAQRQDPARHARRPAGARQPAVGRRHRALRDARQPAVDADDELPGALRLGPAQPVPDRVRSQRRRRPVLHQRRRAEQPRGGRRGRHRSQLRLEPVRGLLSRRPAGGHHRSADRLPAVGGHVITGGAFVPDGLWPAELDGGYLFADAGSGSIFLRRADGSVDYAAPWATDAGGIADMVFAFDEAGRMALYYTLNGNGQLRKIVWNGQDGVTDPVEPGVQLRSRRPARTTPAPGSASRPATCDPTRPGWSISRRRRRPCRPHSSTSRSPTTPAGGSWRRGRRVRCARRRRWSTSCSRARTSPTRRSSRSTPRAGSCCTRRWRPMSSSTCSGGSRRRPERRPPDASCRSTRAA